MPRTLFISLSLVFALSAGTALSAGPGLSGGGSHQADYVQVPRTGPATASASGNDGALPKPAPRFTDNFNGTVTDTLTGHIWTKNANMFGKLLFKSAGPACATLKSGGHGLTDGSEEGDWRLPNVSELLGLMDHTRLHPALPAGHPFTGVQTEPYWSSTDSAPTPGLAYGVNIYSNERLSADKTLSSCHVWCVRGGVPPPLEDAVDQPQPPIAAPPLPGPGPADRPGPKKKAAR